MTFPTAGEILLEGAEGDVFTEQYDHVDPTEYGVRCLTREETDDGVGRTTEKVYYPWRRVHMVTIDMGEK